MLGSSAVGLSAVIAGSFHLRMVPVNIPPITAGESRSSFTCWPVDPKTLYIRHTAPATLGRY